MSTLTLWLQKISTSSLKEISLWLKSGESKGIVILNDYGIDELLNVFDKKIKPISGKLICEEVAIIDQNPRLAQNMSVGENIFLGGKNKLFFNRAKTLRESQKILENYELALDAKQKAEGLTPVQRFKVELLKAYFSGSKVVVFNKIGKLMSAEEKESFHSFTQFFGNLGMSFLYLDSYPDFFLERCSKHYLYKSGRILKIFHKKQLNSEVLGAYLKLKSNYSSPTTEASTSILSFNFASNELHLYPGRCLVIYHEDDRSLNKLLKNIDKTPNSYLIPKNPTENMLFHEQSYLFNLTLGIEKKTNDLLFTARLKKSIKKEFSKEIGPRHRLINLHSLNKRELLKLVYYRAILIRPSLVIIMQPFFGLDMQNQNQVLELVEKLKARSIAVLILTNHLGDLDLVSEQLVEI